MSAVLEPDEAGELIEIRLLVWPQHEGWRLDQFIKARIPRLSRTRIQQMIRAQQRLGGAALRPSLRVRAGEELVLLRPAPEEPEVPRRFSVLYEDEQLLAIDKPSGLPVHATARFHKNTLTAVLRETYAEPVPCLAHRLDRETSGLLLLGRGRPATAALKQAFRQRQVQKSYLAIVHGCPPPTGTIELSLGPDLQSGIRIKMAVDAGGAAALTRYRTLEQRQGYSLVEACPETGRQHQIRAHLAALGFPLVGDKLYGQPPAVWLEFIASGLTPALAEQLILPRHALHAASVSFPHPATAKPLELRCPLAADLQRFWDSLAAFP